MMENIIILLNYLFSQMLTFIVINIKEGSNIEINVIRSLGLQLVHWVSDSLYLGSKGLEVRPCQTWHWTY